MPESYADLGFVPINTTKFLDEESGIDNLLEEMKESEVVEEAAETKLLNVDEDVGGDFKLTFNENLILDIGVKSAVIENLEENPEFIERFLETSERT